MSRESGQKTRSGAQTVERAFDVLKQIAASNSAGATVADLLPCVQLNRTTVHRLIKCLEKEGAIRRDGIHKRYFLGPLAYALGVAARQRFDLKALCAPALSRIASETGDTTFLMLRSGNDAVCIERKLGSYPVKTLVVEVGTRRPLGIGAGSLAILSALPDAETHRVLTAVDARLAAYGASCNSLLNAVRTTRQAGYSSGYVYGVESVIAVGVPILDDAAHPIAAFSVAAIEKRMPKTRQRMLARLLRRETAELHESMRSAGILDC